MKRVLMSVLLSLSPMTAFAMFNDDPWLSKVMAEFEYIDAEHNALEWDVDAWYGRDISKLWIKAEGEYAESEIESGFIEFVYSRAYSANWDWQTGIRSDIASESDQNRNWVSFGFMGTAPYFFDVDARLFIGEDSSSQLIIEAEKEIMLTQEWVLTPEFDVVANGKTSQRFQEGSGLSSAEFSLMLGYEHNGNRKFQPFLGVTRTWLFGASRDMVDHDTSWRGTLGIHGWF